jgi:hypothetical protein
LFAAAPIGAHGAIHRTPKGDHPMKLCLPLVLLVLAFLLSGCAQYWYQDGKTFTQCQQDRADCFDQLQKRTDFNTLVVDYEIKFMNDCMQSKGYKLVTADKLPLNARREEPESSLHWRARGIAGQ